MKALQNSSVNAQKRFTGSFFRYFESFFAMRTTKKADAFASTFLVARRKGFFLNFANLFDKN